MDEYLKLIKKHIETPEIFYGEKSFKSYRYKLGDIVLDQKDLDSLYRTVAKNIKQSEGRSIFHELSRGYLSDILPFKLDIAQIKGCKFSSQEALKQYNGIGVCPLYYYADETGKLNEIRNILTTVKINGSRVGKDAIGTMDFEEAVKEFYMTIFFTENKLKDIYVKYPFSFGKFTNIKYDDGALGFEILLTNKKLIERTESYISCLNKNLSSCILDIIKKRARVLRTLHDNGFLAPFLTLDNLQVFSHKKYSLLHDIGDSRFINRNITDITVEAFNSESFWNLYYILQPNRAILPGADGFDQSMEFLEKNKRLVFESTLLGYFGNDYGKSVIRRYSYADYEDTLHKLLISGEPNTSLYYDYIKKPCSSEI